MTSNRASDDPFRADELRLKPARAGDRQALRASYAAGALPKCGMGRTLPLHLVRLTKKTPVSP